MKLRKPCEHKDEIWPDGHYEPHWYGFSFETKQTCPGGVFLPDDTLVIEKVDGEWPDWFVLALGEGWWQANVASNKVLAAQIILDALSVREAE